MKEIIVSNLSKPKEDCREVRERRNPNIYKEVSSLTDIIKTPLDSGYVEMYEIKVMAKDGETSQKVF